MLFLYILCFDLRPFTHPHLLLYIFSCASFSPFCSSLLHRYSYASFYFVLRPFANPHLLIYTLSCASFSSLCSFLLPYNSYISSVSVSLYHPLFLYAVLYDFFLLPLHFCFHTIPQYPLFRYPFTFLSCLVSSPVVLSPPFLLLLLFDPSCLSLWFFLSLFIFASMSSFYPLFLPAFV